MTRTEDVRRASPATSAVPTPAGLASRRWRPRYSTSRQDLIGEFYEPALRSAVRYDRATGYFRSTLFSLVGSAVADFALRGGKMRLLCAPELLEEDYEAIRRGLALRDAGTEAVLREIERTLEHPLARPRVELLATLVANDTLEVRFILWPKQQGIFHDKVGVFCDEHEHRVSFVGSVNETWRAWHPLGNHESFEVFTSWGRDVRRVTDHETYFESLWLARELDVEVFEPDSHIINSLLRFAAPDPGENLRRRQADRSGTPRRLFDHQQLALANWKAHGCRGVLKHATGSGKTLTALHAAMDWLASGKPVLILVPSKLLLSQWQDEIAAELDSLHPSVLAVGGGNEDWRRKGLLRPHIEPGSTPRITVATLQTASSDAFLSRLGNPSELLVIADEVHRTGSVEFSKVLQIVARGRLGLSATPERAGDPAGTERIFSYFGPIIKPEFTIRDAIDAGRLAPYEYRPETIGLTPDEEEAWAVQTRKIREVYAQEADDAARGQISEYLRFLLIRRARIAKKAARKEPRAAELVAKTARPGEHWLLYCEDRQQLEAVRRGLRTLGVDSLEYHSAMSGDQAATLDRFRREAGVLVSIRCLDEGVDIPSVSHALILASSRNYRQFVQRRGRVLRTAPDKHQATLYDLLVLPANAGSDDAYDGLVFGEILRAATFARDAVNHGARAKLAALCIQLGLGDVQVESLGLESMPSDTEEVENSD